MYELELAKALEAAKKAEVDILRIYATPFEVEIKSDDSPVTLADKTADNVIRAYLSKVFPDDGFLTEESADTPERLKKHRVWIVDPVDGTKEFVSRNGEFTTNIALAVDGEVVVGVINAPTLGITFYAAKGEGAYRINKDGTKTKLAVSSRTDNLRPMRSISFFKKEEAEFMERNKDRFEGEAAPVGAALKFCKIASGEKEFFYRSSNGTKEWDIAPGVLIVEEAGGLVRQPDGTAFTFNRVDVYNRQGYVIANSEANLLLGK